jgi:CTP synthase (UTP-ammonia lyase)
LAERVLGAERTLERYHCSYGLSRAYLDVLRRHGLVFSGADEAGEVRIAELPAHPFFLATLFQPELAGDGTRPHPIIHALATAAIAHSRNGRHNHNRSGESLRSR